MNNTATVVFYNQLYEQKISIEVPLDMTANELVLALNEAYQLRIDTLDIKNCYLKSENPIALLKGNRSLSDFGIIDGSIIMHTK